MKRIVCFMIVLTPFLVVAQGEIKMEGSVPPSRQGIKWTEGVSWKEIFKRAKKENKYVFIDCYATWCGPCKAMEADVFEKKEVGEFFNERFISVRLQMDKTEKDNQHVRKLYSVAQEISKEYGIPAYPTFLFFSPTGDLVNRASGYQQDKLFIEIAKKSIQPGMKAQYMEYYSLLAKYQLGKKDYKTMAGLADTAKLLGQDDIAAAVSKEYIPYLLSRKKEEWMTRSNLSFMANFINGSSDPFFSVFYRQGDVVDSLLKQKGISQYVIDTIIQREEIDPIVKPESGMRLSSEKPDEKRKEPKWDELLRQISTNYDERYAERNVLRARIQWYNDEHDWALCARYWVIYFKKYPPQFINSQIGTFLNYTCWDAIFKRSVDKEQIDLAIEWIGKVVEKFNTSYEVLDTYANLLYKAGRISEAIRYQEEAVSNAPENGKVIRQTLEKIKKGKPTWPHYISRDFWDSGLID